PPLHPAANPTRNNQKITELSHRTNVRRTGLAEAADLRLREVATAIRSAADQGLGGVTPTEVDRWWSDLEAADAADEFLFSETAYIVTARLPG
ncbi:hypothetical protein FF36_06367, partial [Frankia torreyi]